jgi:hypothetical protein
MDIWQKYAHKSPLYLLPTSYKMHNIPTVNFNWTALT